MWCLRWSFRETRKKGDYGLQGPTGPQCMRFKFDLHLIVTIMSTDINNDNSVWTLILPDCETGNQVTNIHIHRSSRTVLLMVMWLIQGRKNRTAVREVLLSLAISLVLRPPKLHTWLFLPQGCMRAGHNISEDHLGSLVCRPARADFFFGRGSGT